MRRENNRLSTVVLVLPTKIWHPCCGIRSLHCMASKPIQPQSSISNKPPLNQLKFESANSEPSKQKFVDFRMLTLIPGIHNEESWIKLPSEYMGNTVTMPPPQTNYRSVGPHTTVHGFTNLCCHSLFLPSLQHIHRILSRIFH